jgi:benzoate/toluate 1,2-dioxygenase subunit beta
MTDIRSAALTRATIEDFLYREARYLDDRDWDAWLALYAKRAVFWMPSWDDDDTLVEDPQREISLIYYGEKQGLEDRVFRIRTDRSSATSLPIPRTSHNISNVEIVEQVAHGELKIRFNWFTLNFRYKTVDTYFGTSHYTLDITGPELQIVFKKVVLKNDYIHHVIDIYHI